ncbi:MAG: tetratricopeptide repeat protein [Thermodesulfobacteriota bacterium]
MKSVAIIVGTGLLLGAPAWADDRQTKFREATSLFEQGRIKEARDQLARLWAFGKGDPRVSLMLGQCEAALNNYEKARSLYQEVLDEDPGNPQAKALMGRLDSVKPKGSVVPDQAPTRPKLETPALDKLERRIDAAKERARRKQAAKDAKHAGKAYERAAKNLRQMYKRNDRIERYEERRYEKERQGWRFY